MKNRAFILCLIVVLACSTAFAQTTEFIYQGQLQNSSAPANGSFDFEFLLYDALSGGNQIGSTLTRSGVAVAEGGFSVKLDFGTTFPGANRFLEIHVRQTGGGAFTPLAPRQPITSAPYAVRSLKATTADAVNAGNIMGVLGTSQGGTGIGPNPPVAGSYLRSDGTGWVADGIHTADIPGGSGSYIQNRTSQQSLTNFNISGDGTAAGTLNADIIRATTHYALAGVRVLSTTGTNNLFVGPGTGTNNTSGTGNSFLGQDAGSVNAGGSFNTFLGRWAGFSNTGSDSNTLVGFGAGKLSTGGSNTFFGANAGNSNTTGSNNTALGANADVNAGNLAFATAIGAGAVASTSNIIKLAETMALILLTSRARSA